MTDIDWMLDDLRSLRDKFREARLRFPRMRSELVQLPANTRSWRVSAWSYVDSYGAVSGHSGANLTSKNIAVDFSFVSSEATCLTRYAGAGWNLKEAVSLFGQLALSTAATLHLVEPWRSIFQGFWPIPDERAWISWMNKYAGNWSEAYLNLTSVDSAPGREPRGHSVSKRLRLAYVEDVFEESSRQLDDIIKSAEDATVPPKAANLKTPDPAVFTLVKNPPSVTYLGTTDSITPDGVTLLQGIIDAEGDWVAAKKLNISKPDRLKRTLPKPILNLIEASPGKGHRLRHRQRD